MEARRRPAPFLPGRLELAFQFRTRQSQRLDQPNLFRISDVLMPTFRPLFDHLDANADGAIDKAELAAALNRPRGDRLTIAPVRSR